MHKILDIQTKFYYDKILYFSVLGVFIIASFFSDYSKTFTIAPLEQLASFSVYQEIDYRYKNYDFQENPVLIYKIESDEFAYYEAACTLNTKMFLSYNYSQSYRIETSISVVETNKEDRDPVVNIHRHKLQLDFKRFNNNSYSEPLSIMKQIKKSFNSKYVYIFVELLNKQGIMARNIEINDAEIILHLHVITNQYHLRYINLYLCLASGILLLHFKNKFQKSKIEYKSYFHLILSGIKLLTFTYLLMLAFILEYFKFENLIPLSIYISAFLWNINEDVFENYYQKERFGIRILSVILIGLSNMCINNMDRWKVFGSIFRNWFNGENFESSNVSIQRNLILILIGIVTALILVKCRSDFIKSQSNSVKLLLPMTNMIFIVSYSLVILLGGIDHNNQMLYEMLIGICVFYILVQELYTALNDTHKK